MNTTPPNAAIAAGFCAGNAAFDHTVAWDLWDNIALYLPLIDQEGGS